MVVGALVGAGLDVAVEAGRRGRVLGRKAGARGRELAHTAAEKVEAADIPGRAADVVEHASAATRAKAQEVAG